MTEKNQHKLIAKKSLGQNFLRDKNIVDEIVLAANLKSGDMVVEIGPGTGVLTKGLLQTEAQVFAYEKDDRAIPLLNEKFATEIREGNLKIIHADYLESNVEDAVKKPYKIIANIPYYITGAIIKKSLESRVPPEAMVLMVQKEVAERIVAADGKHSILSLSVWLFGKPSIVRIVPAEAFNPTPKIDSAILKIADINYDFFNNLGNLEKKFDQVFKIVHAGFAHKRKFLIKNLGELVRPEKVTEAFSKNSIDDKIRAEDLSFEKWKQLIKDLLLVI